MVVKRQCSFCAGEIEPGTGTLYVKRDGSIFQFCSSSCRKQQLHLGRVGHRMKWTLAHTTKLAAEHSSATARSRAQSAAAAAAPARSKTPAASPPPPPAPAEAPRRPRKLARSHRPHRSPSQSQRSRRPFLHRSRAPRDRSPPARSGGKTSKRATPSSSAGSDSGATQPRGPAASPSKPAGKKSAKASAARPEDRSGPGISRSAGVSSSSIGGRTLKSAAGARRSRGVADPRGIAPVGLGERTLGARVLSWGPVVPPPSPGGADRSGPRCAPLGSGRSPANGPSRACADGTSEGAHALALLALAAATVLILALFLLGAL